MPTRTAIILGLADPAQQPAGDGCGACGSSCARPDAAGEACASGPRVPVLRCKDALISLGYRVELITATSDQEIDAVIARLDGSAREDTLIWPGEDGPALVVATESDAQLRHVVRRMVRRYAPAPSKRPTDLPDGRTIPDLPAIGILPMHPATDLADRLGLPRDPVEVAKAVDGGRVRRIDLFRNDGGSITVHGALLGGVDGHGEVAPWAGHVIVDDTVLADGTEHVLACAVANADGYAHLDEIALAPRANASSGVVAVAVAVPVVSRSRFGRRSVRIEVRRASGRAVAVTPGADLPFLDDGTQGVLTRKRTWWVEASAWGVFTI